MFFHWYQFAKKNWIGSLLFFAGLLVLFLGVGSSLRFEEDITKLIPQSEKADQLQQVLNNMQFADKVVVQVHSDRPREVAQMTKAAAALLDSIQKQCTPYISAIQGEIGSEDLGQTLDFIYHHLPYFLDEADYQYLEAALSPQKLAKLTESNFKALISPTGLIGRRQIQRDPLGISFKGLEKLKQLKVGDAFQIENGFLMSKDKRSLLFFIKPALAANETDKNTAFVERLEEIGKLFNQTYADANIQVSYYGSTIVSVANANQIKKDIQLTLSIALGILLLILLLYYRRFLVPIILFLPTLFGGSLALFVLAIRGETVSAISLGIGSVLLGITLDYALHLLTHYRNHPNIQKLYADVTKPIWMSSLTTALAFMCLTLVQSKALQDLGLFASISVLGSAFFALILIPLLVRSKGKVPKAMFIDKLAAFSFSKQKGLWVFIAVLTIGSAFYFQKVVFNTDLAAMNYQTESLLATEKRLNALLQTHNKSLYVTAYGNDLQKVLAKNHDVLHQLQKLKKAGAIQSISAVGGIVLDLKTQQEKVDRWNAFWTLERKEALHHQMVEVGTPLGLKPHTFQAFYQLLAQHSFPQLDLDAYQQISTLFLEEFIHENEEDGFHTAMSMIKVAPDQIADIKKVFAKEKQVLVVDRQEMNEIFLGNLKVHFQTLMWYSLLAVIGILWLFYRQFTLVLITTLPIVLCWYFTSGLMGFLDLEFNIFNIIITTFIFGLGVDYSIFMTNGLRQQYTNGKSILPSYKASIILSVCTTLLGVGALIFAKHPALKSISSISILGILMAVLLSFVLQPILFRLFIGKRTRKGFAPFRIRVAIHSFLLSVFYALGGMVLSVLSLLLWPLIPISKKIKMRWLHRIIARLVTAVLYANPFVKKSVENPHGETFEKPALVIANHSSALDTLILGMVTPNIIYLVNDWVYKSPIFGLLARVAGFYPVSKGVDNSLEHLKQKVRQGYCLVVFPEGKRSLTNKIGRFHKGAFHLAQELELDILPIYIHGAAEVNPKGDFMIYDGSLQVKVGKRIGMEDPLRSGSERAITKNVSKFFKTNMWHYRKEWENVDYFKDILRSNYLYKSENLWETQKALFEDRKTAYREINNKLGEDVGVVCSSDSSGILELLLSLKSQKRKLYSWSTSEKEKEIVSHLYSLSCRGFKQIEVLEEMEGVSNLQLVLDKQPLPSADWDKLISLVEVVWVLGSKLDAIQAGNLIFDLENSTKLVSCYQKIAYHS